jgi:hypothetical protein
MCLTDFIDWRYIHSPVDIFDPACELLPPWTKGTIKTPNPKYGLYWCLIEFIDWR